MGLGLVLLEHLDVGAPQPRTLLLALDDIEVTLPLDHLLGVRVRVRVGVGVGVRDRVGVGVGDRVRVRSGLASRS